MNEGRTYREQVKPFNFMLSARVDDFGLPIGLDDAQHFHLVTRYIRKPREALKATWFNRYDGKPYRVTVSSASNLRGQARVLKYGEILEDYRFRPEHKSFGPDGKPCRGETAGLLGRRSIEAFRFVYVGKESNRLEEAQQGMLHDEEQAVNRYDDPRHGDFEEFVLPVVGHISLSRLVSATGLHSSTLKRIRAGTSRPRVENAAILTALAIEHARRVLEDRGIEVPQDRLAILHLYLKLLRTDQRMCPVCGRPIVSRRATYCGATCRKRAARGNRREVH